MALGEPQEKGTGGYRSVSSIGYTIRAPKAKHGFQIFPWLLIPLKVLEEVSEEGIYVG